MEQRRRDRAAEIRLVALVVWVGDQRDACGNEFRSRRVDPDVGGGADPGEAQLVVSAGHFLVFELGLGDGGLKGHVPQRRRFDLVRLSGGQVVEERKLGDAATVVVDRLVGSGPIDRKTE